MEKQTRGTRLGSVKVVLGWRGVALAMQDGGVAALRAGDDRKLAFIQLCKALQSHCQRAGQRSPYEPCSQNGDSTDLPRVGFDVYPLHIMFGIFKERGDGTAHMLILSMAPRFDVIGRDLSHEL